MSRNNSRSWDRKTRIGDNFTSTGTVVNNLTKFKVPKEKKPKGRAAVLKREKQKLNKLKYLGWSRRRPNQI